MGVGMEDVLGGWRTGILRGSSLRFAGLFEGSSRVVGMVRRRWDVQSQVEALIQEEIIVNCQSIDWIAE